jgi:hypothetical protein
VNGNRNARAQGRPGRHGSFSSAFGHVLMRAPRGNDRGGDSPFGVDIRTTEGGRMRSKTRHRPDPACPDPGALEAGGNREVIPAQAEARTVLNVLFQVAPGRRLRDRPCRRRNRIGYRARVGLGITGRSPPTRAEAVGALPRPLAPSRLRSSARTPHFDPKASSARPGQSTVELSSPWSIHRRCRTAPHVWFATGAPPRIVGAVRGTVSAGRIRAVVPSPRSAGTGPPAAGPCDVRLRATDAVGIESNTLNASIEFRN